MYRPELGSELKRNLTKHLSGLRARFSYAYASKPPREIVKRSSYVYSLQQREKARLWKENLRVREHNLKHVGKYQRPERHAPAKQVFLPLTGFHPWAGGTASCKRGRDNGTVSWGRQRRGNRPVPGYLLAVILTK